MADSGVVERVHTHQGSEIPGRVINLDEARARHGESPDIPGGPTYQRHARTGAVD